MKRLAAVAVAALLLAACRREPVIERVPDDQYTTPVQTTTP